jgi:tRNA (Thr-GGU) A37 N-methylase
MAEFCMKPIGVIHTPFKEKTGTPIQGRHWILFNAIGALIKQPAVTAVFHFQR